jgi:protease secretion system membrane fusion protein
MSGNAKLIRPKEAEESKVEIGSVGLELPLPSDTTWSIRVGMLMLLFGFGGFVLWATLAPLDEGVPAPGMVMIEGKRKTIQHLSGGVVKELNVQEAKMVKAGDVLMRLDDTVTRANFDAALQTWYALLAEEARLQAEQVNAKEIQFPQTLLETTEAAERVREHMATQRSVLLARRTAFQGELSVLAETARAQEELAKGLLEQIEFMRPQLEGMRDLAKEGFMPRNRQLEQERQFAELQANAARAKSVVATSRLNLMQRSHDYRKEVETRLYEVKRDLANYGERVRATRDELERTTITAPADGSVTGLMVFTVGGVVAPGQKLMDIVPVGEGLILEIQIASHLIDRVRAGMSADITFESFVNLPSLVVDGKLISVSADIINNPQQQQNMPPYFLGRVEVTPAGMKKLGKNQMQPGMPASVVVKTGSRSLFDYLLKPLKKRIAQSLTEA